MGPFEWLAGRWTPEFEYRDRLADEVEDIAYESTHIGTRRGFLMGVLIGAILALIGVAGFRFGVLDTRAPTIAGEPHNPPQTTSPEPSSEELNLLRGENQRLKEELTRARTTGAVLPPEKRAMGPKSPVVKKEIPDPRPIKPATRERTAKPEAKPSPSAKAVAQPIPSNCRQEGVCDPTGP